MQYLGCDTLDMHTVVLLSLTMNKTLCRILFLVQLVMLLLALLVSTNVLKVRDSTVELTFLLYSSLGVLTVCTAALPLLVKKEPLIRRSRAFESHQPQAREKWRRMTLYVCISLTMGVVCWGLAATANDLYDENSIGVQICRMDVVGLFQFGIVSLLALGFKVADLRFECPKKTETRPNKRETDPFIRTSVYKSGPLRSI